MKVIALLTLAALLIQIITHNHYTCQFDRDNQDLRQLSKQGKPDVGLPIISDKRILLTNTRNPIRITLDSSSFSTVVPGQNGAATTTEANLAFILRAMQVSSDFYMNRLKVYPITTIYAIPNCSGYITPSNDQYYGIAGSDLHIYVLYITDMNQTYGATAKSCKYYGDHLSFPPDSTLQLGRPTMGRIIFNTRQLTDTQTALTNRLFQSITSTALHQTMHILGFDYTLMTTWLDGNPSSPGYTNNYSQPVITAHPQINPNRSPTSTFLVTPNVASWAQNFFDCASSNLPGMLLQNEGDDNPYSSHWERVAMYDELMTATSLGSVKGFSGLTFAALKDMGWYDVDDTFNQTTNYGYKKGCEFILNACNSSNTTFSQFCNPVTQNGISYCQSNFFSKAICSSSASYYADTCPIYAPYPNHCIDPDSHSQSYIFYTQQSYSTSSFCINSTLGSVAIPKSEARCYPYICGTTTVTFYIGTYTIVCSSSEAGTQKYLSALTGYLRCPIFNDFCINSRKTCPNWCNQNGYCMGGICNCLPGFYGSDCSQTQCLSGTYFNPLNSSCNTNCPSGYYHNIYSQSCNVCKPPCQQCFGQPTVCTGCSSSAAIPQYFYNLTCYTTCPNGTFVNGFNCSICDSTVFCATCNMNSSYCTSCLGGKYLQNPIGGTCINACPLSGTYTVADVQNNKCVSTCADNLILINNTCTFCQNSTFKFISNSSCIATCPDFYYTDSIKHICARCDPSCLTCSGGYAQNCLSCSPTATLRYWLLEMCWSVCPGGYYPDNTDSSCHLCPIALKCANCTYDNVTLSAKCVSCAYGYFLQTGTASCDLTCLSTQYSNRGNNSCVACDSSCVTCSGPGTSSCTSCIPSKFYINNVTGGYCITGCTQAGFTPSSTNCLKCDSTCLTCGGTSANQCTSCPNGTYLNSAGYCRYVCPSTTYPNTILNRCSNCDGSCTYCFGPTINNCTGCITGMVLYNFTCSIRCPTGYTVNQWNVCWGQWMKVFQLCLLLLAAMIW